MTDKNKSPFRARALEMRAQITIDRNRDSLLTDFGRETLERSYMLEDESYQDVFARVAGYYADDQAHAQRLYDYISKLWFMPATPVLSNGGTTRGMPISCFLNDVEDSLEGIVNTWTENVWLARHGGGIGTYWGHVRSIGEKVGHNGKTTGIVPFIKVQDSMTLAVSQGSLRRGSAAMYLPVWHPEIEEFLDMRRPTGGDPNRKALNLHHGIALTDEFMTAVEAGTDFVLRSPKDEKPIRTVSARDIWTKILTTRVETGEPYCLFIDTVNRKRPEILQRLGLLVKQSNLCAEIVLPTGRDFADRVRTAVCCLSSINIEKLEEWEGSAVLFIDDLMRFLDNVIADFCENAPAEMANAVYSALRERSVGLGVMGFHSYLQSRSIPFESPAAANVNEHVHKLIWDCAQLANERLADERGPCLDGAQTGIKRRFSHMIAHAPTASISVICGTTSPSTEPVVTNAFIQKTLSGSFMVYNRHLKAVLAGLGLDNAETWGAIIAAGGSVQSMAFLTDEQKAVFKTAAELDQKWVVKLAAERQAFICQAQSLNIFLPANVHKRELHEIHMLAWKSGLKSLYYLRSQSIKRAEAVNVKVANYEDVAAAKVAANDDDKYAICEACQ